jgi:hypothetical protein
MVFAISPMQLQEGIRRNHLRLRIEVAEASLVRTGRKAERRLQKKEQENIVYVTRASSPSRLELTIWKGGTKN